MDKNQTTNQADALDGVDELLSHGAIPEETAFSLEDILQEYGGIDTVATPKAPAPPEEESPAAEIMAEEPLPTPPEAEAQSEEASTVEISEDMVEAAVPAQEDPVQVPEAELGTQEEEVLPVTALEEPFGAVLTEAPSAVEEMDTTPEPEETDQEASAPVPQEEVPQEEEIAAPEEPAQPAEEPMDFSATADYIMQQVSEAMGSAEEEEEEREDTNPLRSFFVDARRKSAARKQEKQSRETTSALNAAMEAAKQENVLDMPVSRLKPLRDQVNKIQDRANEFADNMWAESGGPTEEEKINEKYVPGTDEEKVPKKSHKERRPRLPLKPFPDTPAEELAARYRLGLRFMGQRMWYLLIVTLLMLYLNLAPSCGLPLPLHLGEQSHLLAGILTWCLGLSCVLGLDVLWMGLTAPFRSRPGMHTLTSCAVLATLLDGLWYLFVGRDGPLPFAAMASFGLLCNLWGAYNRKRALTISCRSIAACSEPYRVTLDADKWDGTGAFNKEAGSEEGFGCQIQSLDGAERIYRFCVPVLLVAALLCAVIASFGQGHPSLFLWCLSSILVAGAPASGLLAFGLPYFRLTHRLDRSGAVLAGWDGVEAMSGKANILIKDEDLFPAGSITLNSTKSMHDVSIEKLAGCTASMLRKAGSGLYHLFDDEIRRQGGFYRRVEDLECYESGGLTANIRGESVMIGTANFLAVMRVPVEQGLGVKRAVFCVINGRLEGIFTLNYELSHYARSSIEALLKAGVQPVLVTRDFNITPEMLRVLFSLPSEQMDYPPIERRKELSAPNQPHNSVVGALLTREGMGAYSDAIIGGRRLKGVVRLNAILTVLSSLVGILLTFYLTSVLAFTSLTPLNLLLFLVIWLIPTLAISGAVDRF